MFGMLRLALSVVLAVSALGGGAAPAQAPRLLLQNPTLSETAIAFDHAGEIWTTPRNGGRASRLVAGQGQSSRPLFSPDGSQIAYTGRYDGNTDVYVVAASGGEPRRLTWHPGRDLAIGWSADGNRILFRSQRKSFRQYEQLFLVPAMGGAPTELPLPSGVQASFSPDGKRLAYTPFAPWQTAWKQHRGGQTTRIWIADLADSKVIKVSRENSNDRAPMWVGDSIYFLSDRDGPVSLFRYRLSDGSVTRLFDNRRGFDIASAGAGPGGIVFDHFGALKIFDFATGAVQPVPVTIAADLPQVRARFEPVKAEDIQNAALSATGKRVLIEARGEIFDIPANEGDFRNLTQSPGTAERDPAISPDSRRVAYFSDASGEYALHVRLLDRSGGIRKIPLTPSFYHSPRWSPDGRKIVFHDKALNLWLVELDKQGTAIRVDTDRYDSPRYRLDPSWSPDSKWIVYTKQQPNHLRAAWVYSLETRKGTQITDGLSDVTSPRFDRSGRYLYFAVSTSVGPSAGWLDMSSLGRAVEGSVYAMVLRKGIPSPLPLESDEESAEVSHDSGPGEAVGPRQAAAKSAGENQKGGGASPGQSSSGSTQIDFDRLDQRIVALPIPAANFAGLEAGPEGVVYTLTSPIVLTDQAYIDHAGEAPKQKLFRFDLKTRKNIELADNVVADSLATSADGRNILFSRDNQWIVTSGDAPARPAEAALKLAALAVWVDPRAEWRQIFREALRIERDYLYDPNLHGLDYEQALRTYAPFVEGIGSRQDLNVLLEEVLGHLGVGHAFVAGGAIPKQQEVAVGLLGADYELVGTRWRISKILRGENWNPKLISPLSQPGVDVREGEFLLAVNGKEVSDDAEVHRAFNGLSGKQTTITVASERDGSGARQVKVVPIASETALRLRSWMEANRRKVEQASGGRVAYVYLPTTAASGFTYFNRYYHGQVGKDAVILDGRFNLGGNIPDYIIDHLKRRPYFLNAAREGEVSLVPSHGIYGPKVMIINEQSGSGGDALPWMFRKEKLGPIIGTRTWGGLVGAGGYPQLIDGGSITAPRWALYSTDGEWGIENIGVPPDIEVEQDPALVRQGNDPQLDRAIQEALRLLEQNPPAKTKRPAAPDRKPVIPEPVE